MRAPRVHRGRQWIDDCSRRLDSLRSRRLGRISKQGDAYLRALFIHGARAAVNAARRRESAGKPLTQLQEWALRRPRTSHANQAVVALANKLVRIAWAVWYHERDFDGDHVIRVAA